MKKMKRKAEVDGQGIGERGRKIRQEVETEGESRMRTLVNCTYT